MFQSKILKKTVKHCKRLILFYIYFQKHQILFVQVKDISIFAARLTIVLLKRSGF